MKLILIMALVALLGRVILVLERRRAKRLAAPYDPYEAFRLNHSVDERKYDTPRDWAP